MAKMILTGKGRRWLHAGHPWVYKDDLGEAEGEPGELVAVEGPNGEPLGWALFSDASRIALRMVTHEVGQPDRAFWLGRVARALSVREEAQLLDPEGACRLLSGDADGVPGMVVDRYGTVLVLQCGTQGADRMRDFLVELLLEALPFEPTVIVDRSDTGVRRLENLEPRIEVLKGTVEGPVIVRDGELVHEVDVLGGHKTGHYLDQVANRVLAARHAPGERVLDAFSYDGLFGIRAALAGAEEVLCLEQNRAACERLVRNAERNGVADRVRVDRTNCMGALKALCVGDQEWGLVVIDPPAFARNRKEVRGAERGYVELNRRGFDLTRAGGRVVSSSCSFAVRPEDFVAFLGTAAKLARRTVWVESLRGAGPDHPWLVTLPESRYLKCAFLRVG